MFVCTGSNLAKECTDCEIGFSYGLSEKEKYDVFGASTLPGGMFWFAFKSYVFINLYQGFCIVPCEEAIQLGLANGMLMVLLGCLLVPEILYGGASETSEGWQSWHDLKSDKETFLCPPSRKRGYIVLLTSVCLLVGW